MAVKADSRVVGFQLRPKSVSACCISLNTETESPDSVASNFVVPDTVARETGSVDIADLNIATLDMEYPGTDLGTVLGTVAAIPAPQENAVRHTTGPAAAQVQ